MTNFDEIMKKAKQMQENVAKAQSALSEIEIDGNAGGDSVKVVLNGKGDMKAINIDPKLVSENELEILEDLIVAAHNNAKSKVESRVAEEMSKVTGGLKLPPGFKLPF